MGHPQNRMLDSCISVMELLPVTITVSKNKNVMYNTFLFRRLIIQNFSCCDTVHSTEHTGSYYI